MAATLADQTVPLGAVLTVGIFLLGVLNALFMWILGKTWRRIEELAARMDRNERGISAELHKELKAIRETIHKLDVNVTVIRANCPNCPIDPN